MTRTSRHTLIAAAATVASLGAGAVASSTSSAASAASASIAPCRTQDLTARVTEGSPGAGQRYATLRLTNHSAHSCHTFGFVGLLLLDAHGRALPTDPVRDHSVAAHRVVLAPGARATTLLHWGAFPGPGDRQAGNCQPQSSRVEITPPDETTHLVAKWPGGPVCEKGRLDVRALR
jgi:hypothetical protein